MPLRRTRFGATELPPMEYIVCGLVVLVLLIIYMSSNKSEEFGSVTNNYGTQAPSNAGYVRIKPRNTWYTNTPGYVSRYNNFEGDKKCLDILGREDSDGAILQQYNCDSNAPNQNFFFDPVTNKIKIYHSGKCLDVLGASKNPGTPIVQYGCVDGRHENQEFEYNPQTGQIHPLGDKTKCLDVNGVIGKAGRTRTWNGSEIKLYDCISSRIGDVKQQNQTFDLVPI